MVASRYVLGQGSGLAPPGAAIYYYLKTASTAPVEITILDHRGEQVVRRLTGPSEAGINRVLWDLRESPLPPRRGVGETSREKFLMARGPRERPGPLVQPGQYRVRLSVGKKQFESSILIEPDAYLRF